MSSITIATWNVNSLKVRLPQVLDWLQAKQPDILALQETKTLDENFPFSELTEAGYQIVCNGQKAYNGVAILSKHPMTDVLKDIPTSEDLQKRIIVATIQNIRIINLYVPNGQAVDSSKYQYKLHWLENITRFIEQELKEYSKVIVLGDFNIAPSDADVYDPILWENRVLFSLPEREAFQRLLQKGFVDSFRLFEQPERSYTWWDYRMLSFRRKLGLRIDHILINESFASACQSCIIDTEPRKNDRPSDHTPVIMTLNGLTE